MIMFIHMLITNLLCCYSINICRTCRNFIPDTLYDEIGRCSLFRDGNNQYEMSIVSRLNPKMCNSTMWEPEYYIN